jgi:predicted NBD/HSP70 family sugar kinase
MRDETSSLTKQFSRRLVAEALLHGAPASRARLSRETGLSKQTISLIIADLEAEGWVRPIGETKGAVGRRAVSYDLASDAALSVGVDLGGSKVSVALADLVGRTLAETTEATDRRGGAHVFRQVQAIARALAKSCAADLSRARSIVVGMPGVVDPKTGGVALAPNIRGLSEISAPRLLSELFGAPVAIENDVNLAMLGEAWRGSARGAQNAAFLALGTGVGLGLIVNGQLARGASGAAGEIAYLPIGKDIDSDAAREIGAFELEVGSAGILGRYNKSASVERHTVREVFDQLAQGERAAIKAIDATARSVALAVTSLAALLDPEMVVLGGSVGVRPELVERVRAAMPKLYSRPVDVRASALGARAGLVGAVSLAANRLHNNLFGLSGVPGELSLPQPAARDAA